MLAVLAGAAIGIVLFVPFVTISYRRRGGLSFGRFVLWAAALVYFFAIWTYTLLPMPDPDTIRCAGVNLDPAEFIRDIRGAVTRPGDTWTDPAILQLVLNVVLFVPIGFFVRALFGRGIVTALLIGAATSAIIETTQLTGVWSLYPCAYRVFDVVDLLTNTSGVAVGSVLSLLLPRRYRGAAERLDADGPRPVTKGRRLLAMTCDGLGVLVVGGTAALGTQLVLLYAVGDREATAAGTAASIAFNGAPLILWGILVLATGRTVGDIAVQLEYTGGPLPPWLSRPLRFLGGIAGFLLLNALPTAWTWTASVFVLVAVAAALVTRQGRGLPGLLTRQELQDVRQDSASHSSDERV